MQGLAAADTGNGNGADQIVPSGMPVPGMAPDVATESVSFSGSNSGVGMFGMSTDELDQRMREGREQGGGFGGGGGPGGGGGRAAGRVAAVLRAEAAPVAGLAASAAEAGGGGPMVLGGGQRQI